MEFLTENSAIIDLQTRSVTFSSDHSTTPVANPEHRAAARITDDHVTVPPRASLMITVYCEGAAPDVDAIVDSDQRLLLDRDVSIARGIALFMEHQSHVLVTNFTEEYQHLNKGAAIAFLEETQKTSQVIVVGNSERARADDFKLPYSFDLNPALPQEKRDQLLDLLRRTAGVFRRTQNYVTDT